MARIISGKRIGGGAIARSPIMAWYAVRFNIAHADAVLAVLWPSRRKKQVGGQVLRGDGSRRRSPIRVVTMHASITYLNFF